MVLAKLKFWLRAGASCALISGGAAAPAQAIEVVASIKPIHAIVAGVMEGAGEPSLLITGAGSPHTATLRPSEARALSRAEVVFWVGPGLETFMAKPLQALAGDAAVVALAAAEGVVRLAVRPAGAWAAGEDPGAAEGADSGEHGSEHAHARKADMDHLAPGQVDMHVWLDPRNAIAMAGAIAQALQEADPGHAAIYERNATRLRDRIADLDRALQERLSPVRERPFIVFHDAYRYLEERYGLNAVGAITLSPERRPGAQHLREIKSTIEELDVVCVFAEPQFEPALARTVVEGTDARTGTLDPLGAGLDAGPEQYFELMQSLADSLVGCLSGTPAR